MYTNADRLDTFYKLCQTHTFQHFFSSHIPNSSVVWIRFWNALHAWNVNRFVLFLTAYVPNLHNTKNWYLPVCHSFRNRFVSKLIKIGRKMKTLIYYIWDSLLIKYMNLEKFLDQIFSIITLLYCSICWFNNMHFYSMT